MCAQKRSGSRSASRVQLRRRDVRVAAELVGRLELAIFLEKDVDVFGHCSGDGIVGNALVRWLLATVAGNRQLIVNSR